MSSVESKPSRKFRGPGRERNGNGVRVYEFLKVRVCEHPFIVCHASGLFTATYCTRDFCPPFLLCVYTDPAVAADSPLLERLQASSSCLAPSPASPHHHPISSYPHVRFFVPFYPLSGLSAHDADGKCWKCGKPKKTPIMHSSNACALRSTIVPFAHVYMLQTGWVGGAVHRTRWRLASTTRVSTYMKTSHTTNEQLSCPGAFLNCFFLSEKYA